MKRSCLFMIFFPWFLSGQVLNYTVSTNPNTACGCTYTGPKILINQFCAQPTYGNASIYGNDGQLPLDPNLWNGEWIELYNPSPCSASDISNYIVGTTINMNPLSYKIPAGTIIPPKGFAVIRGNKAPVPPAGTVDLLITDNTAICSQDPSGYFWLPSETGLGGWFCIYSDQGVAIDAVKYGAQYPSNTQHPCNPPGNVLPAGTVLSSLVNLTGTAVMHDFSPPGTPVTTSSNGYTYYRTSDGGPWSASWMPEGPNMTFGSCNNPANCAQPQPSCNGTATITLTSGTAPYTYAWNTDPVQTDATATGLCSGNYCCTVTDANGLSQEICVTVTDQLFTINGTVVQTACNEANGSIHLNPGGNPPCSYIWIPNVSTTNTAENLNAGTYHITVTAGTCQKDTSIVILPSDGVILSVDTVSVNCSTNLGSATVIPTEGTPPYSIVWNTSATTATIDVSPETFYTVTVTDTTGCSVTDTVKLSAPVLPSISLSVNPVICQGDSVRFSTQISTQSGIISWTGPANFNSSLQNPFIFPATDANTGLYLATVNDSGCIGSDSIYVSVHPNPVIDFVADHIKGCAPLETTLSYSSDLPLTSVIWNLGDGNIPAINGTIEHTYPEGIYSLALFGTTADGCSSTVIHMNMIESDTNALAQFTVNQTTAMIDNPSFVFTNHSQHASGYLWNFDDQTTDNTVDPVHLYKPVPGYYDVMLIANNAANCPDTARITVEITEPLIFYIPNTFTPDGDAHNPVFQPVFTSGYDAAHFQFCIFDRWGELVFQTGEPNHGWDGRYNGRSAQDGTYTWTVMFKDKNNDRMYYYNGHVNLLR